MCIVRLQDLGNTEVQNLHPAVFCEEEIFGFQVAMNDSFLVRGRQSVRNLHSIIHNLPNRQRTVMQSIAKRLTFEQLRNDVWSVVPGSKLIDRDDIRVAQCSSSFGLLFESDQPVRFSEDKVRQNLYGNVTAQRTVTRTVDFSHAAGAESRQNLVRAYSFTQGKRHRCAPL